jgi:hypothetical protein
MTENDMTENGRLKARIGREIEGLLSLKHQGGYALYVPHATVRKHNIYVGAYSESLGGWRVFPAGMKLATRIMDKDEAERIASGLVYDPSVKGETGITVGGYDEYIDWMVMRERRAINKL